MKISQKLVKWVLKRKGLPMCKMCDEAVAEIDPLVLCMECFKHNENDLYGFGDME
jgi:hypothetical protein